MKNIQMIKVIKQLGFNALWENDAEERAFFELCNQVRKAGNLPEFSWSQFDEGWRNRTVLHQDYPTALGEFYNLCCGWW